MKEEEKYIITSPFSNRDLPLLHTWTRGKPVKTLADAFTGETEEDARVEELSTTELARKREEGPKRGQGVPEGARVGRTVGKRFKNRGRKVIDGTSDNESDDFRVAIWCQEGEAAVQNSKSEASAANN